MPRHPDQWLVNDRRVDSGLKREQNLGAHRTSLRQHGGCQERLGFGALAENQEMRGVMHVTIVAANASTKVRCAPIKAAG